MREQRLVRLVVHRAAVLGKPVAHSLSPVLHRAAYDALGLHDWEYRAIECDGPELAALLAESDPSVVGYSCTMPLKRVALAAADAVSAEAAAIGAANTLLRVDDEGGGQWFADNTDWIGIRNALRERQAPLTGPVVLLGAGGTAQAAIAALADAGTDSATALVREQARASELVATAERFGVDVRLGPLGDPDQLAGAGLVISTLPAHAADPLVRYPWRPGQALLDVVYEPWPTAFAASAAAGHATVVSGAAMLLHQAGRQVELMTGRAAPIEAMRAAMSAAAPGCGV